MNQLEISDTIRNQLAIDLNCQPEDFLKDQTTYTTFKVNEGRRAFPRKSPHIEMATIGKGVVICTGVDIHDDVKDRFKKSSKDEIFNSEFIIGHTHYYVPDVSKSPSICKPDDLRIQVWEREEIQRLYQIRGFSNSLQYNVNAIRPDVIAITASENGNIIGISAASEDCKTMWQIGVDVLPDYRGKSIASYLVWKLSQLILEKGKVSYYGTTSSNIASQRVAYRAGFAPSWLSSYMNRWEQCKIR